MIYFERLLHLNQDRKHNFGLSMYNPSYDLLGADQSEELRSPGPILWAIIIRWNVYSKPIKFRKLERKGQMGETLDVFWLKWLLLQLSL